MSKLSDALRHLDKALTGKQEIQPPETLEEWIFQDHELAYLSDGGYSRVAISSEDLLSRGIVTLSLVGPPTKTTLAQWNSEKTKIAKMYLTSLIKEEAIKIGWIN